MSVSCFSDGAGRIFLAACALHAKACEVPSAQYDLVVASCGGMPKDINFIQAHKAVHNAGMFVRDGGLLLLYAACRDGIGSTTFLPWFELGGFSQAFRRLADGYAGNGGTALAMMAKTGRIRIGLISNLDVNICRLIGVQCWQHEQRSETSGRSWRQSERRLYSQCRPVGTAWCGGLIRRIFVITIWQSETPSEK